MSLFDLSGRVVVITGGGGLLGYEHAAAIASAGGTSVLLDLDGGRAEANAARVSENHAGNAVGLQVDITSLSSVETALAAILTDLGRVDVLINNAANNPKVDSSGATGWSRVENFPLDVWEKDLAVGLTGAFFCSRVFGSHMAGQGGGSIVNIASDLGVIAPDQRLYRVEGLPAGEQPVKPVTYSVVKTGLIGLTRYLATYWADSRVRVNALSPGGVQVDQPEEFLHRVSQLIPLGRMAHQSEYRGAILFLSSEASSYMTGQNLIIDGGRTCW